MPEPETIRYTADVVALRRDRIGDLQVLVVRRRFEPFADCWALPGGHVDVGETAREAAVRELAEETGLCVPAAWLEEVGVFDDPGRDPRGFRYVSVAFLVVVKGDTSVHVSDETTDVVWRSTNLSWGLAFDHDAIQAAALRWLRRRPHVRVAAVGRSVTSPPD
jgi:8-oxo-dGTP diphosphatase